MVVSRPTRRAALALLAAVAVATLAAVAYRDVLTYWFTGTDTISLIETSRVGTVRGAVALFTEPLMQGTHFTDRALFYRPVASLSYAIDYAIWGLDPFGYHLTDLALHALAAALVVALVYEVLADLPAATVAGAIFALHPLAVELVPTPARRHDVLATVFALLAVWLFIRATNALFARYRRSRAASTDGSGHPLALVFGSVLACLLAFGSKELAVVVPVLVGTWFSLAVFANRPSLRTSVKSAFVLLGPYVLATAGYLVLRVLVLGGVGGYDRPVTELSMRTIGITISRYTLSLLYPVDFIGSLADRSASLHPAGLYVVVAIASILIVYELVRARDSFSLGVLARPSARLLAFSAVWFLVLIPLFVFAGRYTVRSGYLAIVPVAIALSVALLAALRAASERVGASTPETTRTTTATSATDGGRILGSETDSQGSGPSGPSLATLAVVCLLCLSLLAGSPLVQSYEEWRHAGEVSQDTLEAVTAGIEDTPANASVEVEPVPHPRSARRMGSAPHPRSVTFVWGNTITAWLRLHDAAANRTISLNGTTTLAGVPDRITATPNTTTRSANDSIALTIDYEYNNASAHRPAAGTPSIAPGSPPIDVPTDRLSRSVSIPADRRSLTYR